MRILDIVTGLLLLGVALAIAYVVVRVLLWQHIAALFSRLGADDNKPANTHLVGATGHVVQDPGSQSGRFRVRIGMERWEATLKAGSPHAPAAGTPIRVTAVDGLTLQVEAVDGTETVTEPAEPAEPVPAIQQSTAS